MKLISNFIDGKITLWKSFWIVGFCHPYALGLFILILEELGLLQIQGTLYIVPSIMLVSGIFATIGVWRSANKYKGNKIFGILARIFMLLTFIFIFTEFGNPWDWDS
jgi:hypothetical protein